MSGAPCALYVRGVRVRCLAIGPECLPPENPAVDRAAADQGAHLAMERIPGPAPDGWTAIPRGFAKPRAAQPEPLTPLDPAHFAAMRGLYGLFAGRYSGMLARENPAEWESILAALKNPLGLFENGRLLVWLDAAQGVLTELSAAPDAMERIPGALAAAGIIRAPAPLLGIPAEEMDDSLKLRLIRPFSIPGETVSTPEQLARAMDGAVQWNR